MADSDVRGWHGSPLRASARLVVLLGLAAGVAGCSLTGTNQGDPAAPVLIQGRVVDAAGSHGARATLTLTVSDYAAAEVGEQVRQVFSREFGMGSDGSFALHLALEPVLRDFAAANHEPFINFDLIVQFAGTVQPFGFSRDIAGGTWAGAPTSLVISPTGVVDEGAGSAGPAPLPAKT